MKGVSVFRLSMVGVHKSIACLGTAHGGLAFASGGWRRWIILRAGSRGTPMDRLLGVDSRVAGGIE